MKVGRLEAFSDGVYAILITILVLEFKIPGYQSGKMAHEVLRQWPIMVAYIISFVYVGIIWLFHHDFFQTLRKTSGMLNVINLLVLFSVTLIDYPTALMSSALTSRDPSDLRFAFIYYDLVAMFISVTFEILYIYVGRHSELTINKKTLTNLLTDVKFDPIRSSIIYAFAAIMTYFSVWIGFALLIFGIIYHFFAYIRLGTRIQNQFL